MSAIVQFNEREDKFDVVGIKVYSIKRTVVKSDTSDDVITAFNATGTMTIDSEDGGEIVKRIIFSFYEQGQPNCRGFQFV